jgi:peroxiredoxin
MSLEEALRNRSKQFTAETPSEIVTAMLQADVSLMCSGLTEHALKAGDLALDFSLSDIRGNTVSLSSLRKSGPVVISFYRGDWCPYCTLELQALAELHPEIVRLGASLIAISPQKPDSTAALYAPFMLANDPGSKVARDYGLAFRLPDALHPIYERLGYPLSKVNAASDWVLPIPATYVVAPDGRIVLSYVDVDYRHRLEPSEITKVLSGLRRERSSSWRT